MLKWCKTIVWASYNFIDSFAWVWTTISKNIQKTPSNIVKKKKNQIFPKVTYLASNSVEEK